MGGISSEAARRIIIALVVVIGAILLWAVIFFFEQEHAMPICRPPSVPIRELDERLTGIGCATLGPYRASHGVWVDTGKTSWYYPDATAAPTDLTRKTDGWVFVDAATRAAIGKALPPIAENEEVKAQVVSISFVGTEYSIDAPNKYGLHRFFDVGPVRAVHLLKRDFTSDRVLPKQ